MQFLRKRLARFPFLEIQIKSLYWSLQGIPQVSCSAITKELICECVGKQNPTILEIGCNDGGHTLWFLEVFENPKIYCFEPDPRPIARFKTKIGQHPNVKLFEMALSDRNGEITFYQSDGHKTEATPESWDLSGSIRQPKEHLTATPWVTFERSITVESATLDTWCNEHGIEDIDFIWMDVQGAEIDVFRGGKNAFCKTRFVYTEYSNKELYKGQHTLKQLLRQLRHFEVLIRYPNDMLLRNKKFAFAPNKALQGMLSNSHR